jgi:hypothetical protein
MAYTCTIDEIASSAHDVEFRLTLYSRLYVHLLVRAKLRRTNAPRQGEVASEASRLWLGEGSGATSICAAKTGMSSTPLAAWMV